MRKKVILTIICVLSLFPGCCQSAFAKTNTEVVKPSYEEDTAISVSFKDGQYSAAEYVYTGQKVKPEIVVKKMDGTIAKPSEYKVTYDDDCEKMGTHFVKIEYLKSGYKVQLDYMVVPGKTSSINMSASKGKVTISWVSVPGAQYYRVYKKDAGRFTEVYWPDGGISGKNLSFTFSDLKPGETYEIGIMALPQANSMPTDQMKTYTFTVPKNGESGNNTTAEKTTSVKVAETAKETVEVIVTTTAEEKTTVAETAGETTEVTETKESTTKAKITAKNKESTTQKDRDEKSEKAEFNVWKVVPLAVAIIGVGAGTGIIIYKKKK